MKYLDYLSYILLLPASVLIFTDLFLIALISFLLCCIAGEPEKACVRVKSIYRDVYRMMK